MSRSANSTANIVFDVGNVLINLDFTEFMDKLRQHGLKTVSVDQLIEYSHYHRYEAGQISSAQFLANVFSLLSIPIAETEFITVWNSIFRPVPLMLELAARLKAKYKLYLLSNTNELHWDYCLRQFKLKELAHGIVTSVEARSRKPEPEIFHYAARKFVLPPAETLFIDDLEENVAGAMKLGWDGIWHTSLEETVRQLSARGVL